MGIALNWLELNSSMSVAFMCGYADNAAATFPLLAIILPFDSTLLISVSHSALVGTCQPWGQRRKRIESSFRRV